MLKSLPINEGVSMVKLFLGWAVIALLIGCSSKEEQALLVSYSEKNQYHKNLQRTEKVQLYDGKTSTAILTATHLYIPNFDKNDTRDEVFIIGVQFQNPESSVILFDKNGTFDIDRNITMTNENEYILTLNKNHALKVVQLDANDARLKNVSFVADWGEYYEVTFPHAGTRFSLVFENAYRGKGVLKFSKRPKFVYTKKGF